jgi:gluconolactonase
MQMVAFLKKEFVLGWMLLASLGLGRSAVGQDATATRVTEAADPVVQLISDQFKFTEGPTADTQGNVYFTDQPSNRILLWTTDGKIVDFLKPAGRSNGLYFAQDGKLIACADEANQMWEVGSDASHRVLFEGFEGKRLNGPNDVWVDTDGTIYFTDPYYQRPWWDHKRSEMKKQSVYKVDRDGSNMVCVDDALVQPNGIIGDSGKRILYVADIGDKKTYKYHIARDGSLIDRQVFCLQGSDGMTLDRQGNVYLTGSEGVYVYNESGSWIQTIRVPESWTANVCLGGEDRRTLFITAMDSVYMVRVQHPGVGSK